MKPFYLGITAGLLTILLNTATAEAAINPINKGITLKFELKTPSLEERIQKTISDSKNLREKASQKGLTRTERKRLLQQARTLYQPIIDNPDEKNVFATQKDFMFEYTRLILARESFEAAISMTQLLLKLDYTNGEAHYLLGLAKSGLDEHTHAIEHYKDALRYGVEKKAVVLSRLAYSTASTNKIQDALIIIEEAIISDPDEYYPHFIKGYILSKLGENKKAEEEYNHATQLNDSDYNVWSSLGELHEANKDYKSALSCFKKGMEILPDSPYFKIKIRSIEKK